jgi:hypothetical protein
MVAAGAEGRGGPTGADGGALAAGSVRGVEPISSAMAGVAGTGPGRGAGATGAGASPIGNRAAVAAAGGGAVGRSTGAGVAATVGWVEARCVGSASGAVVEPGTGAPVAFGAPASGTRAAGAAALAEARGAVPAGGASGERGAVSGKRGAGMPGPLVVLGVTSVRAAGEDAARSGRTDRRPRCIREPGRRRRRELGAAGGPRAVPVRGAEGAWGDVSGKRGEAVGAAAIDGPVDALGDASGSRPCAGAGDPVGGPAGRRASSKPCRGERSPGRLRARSSVAGSRRRRLGPRAQDGRHSAMPGSSWRGGGADGAAGALGGGSPDPPAAGTVGLDGALKEQRGAAGTPVRRPGRHRSGRNPLRTAGDGTGRAAAGARRRLRRRGREVGPRR